MKCGYLRVNVSGNLSKLPLTLAKSAQESFYGVYPYDKNISQNLLLRKINAAVEFSSVDDIQDGITNLGM